MKYETHSLQETQDLGRKLAQECKGGEIFALVGELGAGKTTFVQGFAEGLGIHHRIVSPTFILMRSYEIPPKTLYHVDLYRIENNVWESVIHLGLPDVWGKEDAIVVIEWAEKIKDKIPSNAQWVTFSVIGDQARKIDLE